MDKKSIYPKIAIIGAVLIALIIGGYFFFNPKQETKSSLSQEKFPQTNSGTQDIDSISQQPESQPVENQNTNIIPSKETSLHDQNSAALNSDEKIVQTSEPENKVSSTSPDPETRVEQTSKTNNTAIKISTFSHG